MTGASFLKAPLNPRPQVLNPKLTYDQRPALVNHSDAIFVPAGIHKKRIFPIHGDTLNIPIDCDARPARWNLCSRGARPQSKHVALCASLLGSEYEKLVVVGWMLRDSLVRVFSIEPPSIELVATAVLSLDWFWHATFSLAVAAEQHSALAVTKGRRN